MSEPHNASPRRRRLPLAVAIPVLVLIAAFGAWSLVWYEGTRRAEVRLDSWLAAEAQRGRTYDCASREIGGYPFRVELVCSGMSADFDDATPRVRFSADQLQAVAMVWALDHIILAVDGPVRIESLSEDGETEHAMDAEWSRFQSSVRVPEGRITNVDVVIEDPSFRPAAGISEGPTASAGRLEIHQRLDGGNAAEVALNAAGLTVAHAALPPTEAIDFALHGRLIALPDPMPRQPADFLAAWRANQGALEIVDLRAVQNDSVIRAEGDLRPDAQGQPEGKVTVSLVGPDLESPGSARAFGGAAPILATALGIAGRSAEIDGRQGVSGDIEFRRGRLYFGPLPIAELPRLF